MLRSVVARTDALLPVRGRVTVVGVCASGKTALVGGLRGRGYDARHCVQEHSYVPDMWERFSRPEVLVYLDASLRTVQRRRAIEYGAAHLAEQRRRLAHARLHCHVYVQTDALTEAQTLERVIAELHRFGLEPATAPRTRVD